MTGPVLRPHEAYREYPLDAMRRRVMQLERGRIVRDESRGVYEGPAIVREASAPEASPNGPASIEPNGQYGTETTEGPSEEPSEEPVAAPGEPDEG